MLLYLGLMINHIPISSINILDKANRLRAFLRDLNLASTHAIRDDMLGGCGTILHIGDLGLSLRPTFSNSLDCGNDLLLTLSLESGGFFSLLPRLGLIDLQLENSVI